MKKNIIKFLALCIFASNLNIQTSEQPKPSPKPISTEIPTTEPTSKSISERVLWKFTKFPLGLEETDIKELSGMKASFIKKGERYYHIQEGEPTSSFSSIPIKGHEAIAIPESLRGKVSEIYTPKTVRETPTVKPATHVLWPPKTTPTFRPTTFK